MKIKKVKLQKSLFYLNPKLSKQWHPTKNGELTPKDVTVSSSKVIWWVCDKGHEWMELNCIFFKLQ